MFKIIVTFRTTLSSVLLFINLVDIIRLYVFVASVVILPCCRSGDDTQGSLLK